MEAGDAGRSRRKAEGTGPSEVCAFFMKRWWVLKPVSTRIDFFSTCTTWPMMTCTAVPGRVSGIWGGRSCPSVLLGSPLLPSASAWQMAQKGRGGPWDGSGKGRQVQVWARGRRGHDWGRGDLCGGALRPRDKESKSEDTSLAGPCERKGREARLPAEG